MNQSDFDRLRRLHPAYVSGDDIELSVGEALQLIDDRIQDDAPPLDIKNIIKHAIQVAELPDGLSINGYVLPTEKATKERLNAGLNAITRRIVIDLAAAGYRIVKNRIDTPS